MKGKEYIGILLGGIYGFLYRLLCEKDVDIFDFSIFSISFIWILPIAMGLIPILFFRPEMLESKSKLFLFPLASVILFFLIALSSGLEDWVCILILTLPFTITAGISGLVLGDFLKKRNSKKLYSIIFLPFLLAPIESKFSNRIDNYIVESKIIIEASKADIWNNIIEVPFITESEYEYGFYNFIGVPRPIKSELKEIDGTQYRIGYFTDKLKLTEKISQIDPLNYVEFMIDIQNSSLRDLPTDKHILESNYFQFDQISYRLVEMESGKIELKLNCEYTIESKMNWYANFWAKRIIKDFEVKLLSVLKHKIES